MSSLDLGDDGPATFPPPRVGEEVSGVQPHIEVGVSVIVDDPLVLPVVVAAMENFESHGLLYAEGL